MIQALPRFREDSSLSTWIYRIATNAAYDRLRSRSSRNTRDVPLDGHAAVEDKAPGADQRLARRDRLRKDLGDGCDFYRNDRNEFACDPKPTGVSRRD